MKVDGCCCLDLRTGTIIILILNIIQYTVPRPALQYLSEVSIIFQYPSNGTIVQYQFNDWALLAMIVGYVVYGLTLYGVIARKPSHMIVYLVLSTAYTLFFSLVTILLAFSVIKYHAEDAMGFSVFLLFFAINVYSLLVVYSYYKHLRQMQTGETRRLVDRYGAIA
ncbi:hypothetical protein HCN44_004166 [Aphidius gifuensis]|uniref:Uncharacterized protein n=1 Tax=Aphidius gifuensis TaxID=684658 RepID=A0A835CS78_APHGI|nr:uncharacterized protein LOC122848456 [Aphidius gifuensis]KAF7994694.1 hypothetical protein HCN44_004166 [Aphidius gifuensis]